LSHFQDEAINFQALLDKNRETDTCTGILRHWKRGGFSFGGVQTRAGVFRIAAPPPFEPASQAGNPRATSIRDWLKHQVADNLNAAGDDHAKSR
jgi:hypothetical protein